MADWITDSQDEQSLEELLRDADQVRIPIFQRSYIWKQKQFDELCQDIRLIRDTVENSQFLGAVVAYERPRPSVVGRLRVLDVVDGQQRLLTLYIFVMAITEHMASLDKEVAAEIVQEFLLLASRRGLEVNTRVVPAYDDRNQFRSLWDRINSPDVLQDLLQNNRPHPPSPSGDSVGVLVAQYTRISRFLSKTSPRDRNERLDYLREILDIVTRKLTFVHLKLNDASVATKIFERLNFRGIRVGIVDLVRNEVFSRVSDDPGDARHILEHHWQPLESRFQGRAEAFFFPYCLIHNNNIIKSELFTQLRSTWNGLSPQQIIEHMTPYQKPFMAIDQGITNYDSSDLNQRLERLHRLSSPSAIYSYIIKVVYEYQTNNLSEDMCLKFLDFTESFLVRRAIMGFEPTGLHALFKGMWNEISPDPTVDKIIAAIDSRPTIQSPSDEDIRTAIKTRPLAKARICKYLLAERDISLPGDNPSEDPTIEHILPQSYDRIGYWGNLFSLDEHRELKDTWANLIPLSNPLNSSLQAADYDTKRQRYEDESMFITPRHLASNWSEWTIDSINDRATQLANWAIKRWPNSAKM